MSERKDWLCHCGEPDPYKSPDSLPHLSPTCRTCGWRVRQQESEGVVVDAAYCPECNPKSVTKIDEDGCCATCGADAVPCKARLTRMQADKE